jgi:hypothetical protein
LFDIINERPRQLPKDPRQVQALNLEEQQAVNYALSQKPKSVNEFVEQVQMYKAVIEAENKSRFGRYNAAITRILRENGVTDIRSLAPKQQTKIREQASQEVFGRAFDGKDAASREAYISAVESAGIKDAPGQVNPQMQARVRQVYQQIAPEFKNRLGSIGGIDPHQNPTAFQQQIRNLNAQGKIRFNNETAGVYHVAKHYDVEFPLSERLPGRTNVENYLAGASRTISNPTRTSVGYDQLGNRVIIFEREIPSDKPGKILIGKAIVRVSQNGETSLASYYIPGGK